MKLNNKFTHYFIEWGTNIGLGVFLGVSYFNKEFISRENKLIVAGILLIILFQLYNNWMINKILEKS